MDSTFQTAVPKKADDPKLKRVQIEDMASIAQVAKRLKVPHQTVRYAIKSGRIPPDGVIEVDRRTTILLWSRCKDLKLRDRIKKI